MTQEQMKLAYIASGAAICLLFAVASMSGWRVIDFDGITSNKPKGASIYHK